MEPSVIARVRLFKTAKKTDREFDYLCPADLTPDRGAVVKVPFGKGDRETYGVVCALAREIPQRKLKSILAVADEAVRLNDEMMALCHHLQEHIFCTFGEAARAMIPSPAYRKKEKTYRIWSLSPTVDPKTCLEHFSGKNKALYQRILDHLDLAGPTPEQTLRELFDPKGAYLRFLETRDLIVFHEEAFLREGMHYPKSDAAKETPLSPAQEEAFITLREQWNRREASAALLHGITGSGKTSVMLSLCDHVLSQGKTVLFLVPEIALTGQSARLLCQRYGDKVAILHSALSEGERRDAFVAIARGEKPVVLGTRSAVFAPLTNLGLLLIDEEQDQSYKSDTQFKYHARDVARFRCAYHKAMLLLASATPDIESYYKAKSGKYKLVTLSERYGNAVLPQVEIVDLRPDLRRDPSKLLGVRLQEEIRQNLERQEQTILLMNRRGYRQFLSCTRCGEVVRCPNCSVSLTLHSGKKERLSCHYCGYTVPVPDKCEHCDSEHLLSHGAGIQQLEEELRATFPESRILRLDSDALTAKDAHERILTSFRKKEADILIGTQMVAKGHNFPDVTLVGVVMADSALYLSDYRAGEHAFSLITQVIGRAGRAEKKGRALIQTLNPQHNVYPLAARQNYSEFYEGEILLRKNFQFPPFCRLGVFTLSSQKENEVLSACQQMQDILSDLLNGAFSDVKVIVYGPFEAPVYRVKNVYRKRFILKYKDNARNRALLENTLIRMEEAAPAATVVLDVDPAMV